MRRHTYTAIFSFCYYILHTHFISRMDNQSMCCPHQIIDVVYAFILVWRCTRRTLYAHKSMGMVCFRQCQYIKPELIQIDRLVKRNLNEFIEILQSDRPLFCVDAVLSTPHISLQPTGVEVCNTIMQVVNGFLERYIARTKDSNFWRCCQCWAKKYTHTRTNGSSSSSQIVWCISIPLFI